MKTGSLAIIRRLGEAPGRFTSAYAAGLDCGRNGSNEANCHFAWFASPDMTKEWERGKRDGESSQNRDTGSRNADG